jgi:acetolactate synthase-1/2/3 large subunit
VSISEHIADRLAAQRVGSVFAVAGASHARLLDALDRRGMHIVSSRHESGAVGAADGYARVTRGPGVALIIAEQGLPNAVGALAAASLAGSPVIALVACLPRSLVEPGSELADAGVGAVERWCRFCAFVEQPDELAAALDGALATLANGRRGPALLCFPSDLLAKPVNAAEPAPVGATATKPPEPALIAQAAELIANARRPLIIAGGGAYWSRAGDALTRFAARASIPVTANSLGRGLVPEDWQHSFSWPYAQIAARDADVVLVAGARLTQRLGFGLPPRFADDARFIQIDIDEREQHRSRPIDVFLHADVRESLDAVTAALDSTAIDITRREWLARALEPRRQRVAALLADPPGSLHPLQIGRAADARLQPGAILVGDGADIQSWMYGAVAIRHAPGFMDHYPMGAMGIGTPLAIGAATALRDRHSDRPPPVFLITGDGSLGFYPAELHAAASAGLRLIVIVGNDGAWGTEVHDQRQAIGRELNTRLGQLPYEKLAEAFGCIGLRADSPETLDAALDSAIAADRPVLINALLDVDDGAALKSDPLLRMILFSDLAEGRRRLSPPD